VNVQTTSTDLGRKQVFQTNWMQRLGLCVLFLACGLVVFIVFSHYHPFYTENTDLVGRVVGAGVFLTLALLSRFSEHFQKYWLISFAFFVALTAISVDKYLSLSKWIYPAFGIIERSPAGLAVNKLESSLLGIIIALTLNRLAGQKVESLYIRRGNLRLGLTGGLVAFVMMIATVIPVTDTFFKGEDLTWARIISWSPWVLIFVLANASNEELIFRGLFIGKMDPFLGKFFTNIVTTIPFVLAHSYTGYATDTTIFLALQVLPISLAWCWLMKKTNSIWESILFHEQWIFPSWSGFSRIYESRHSLCWKKRICLEPS
jgi:membrane protease YdiL (CAAX protease family)